VRAFRPSLTVVTLYIGLKGRLRALGPDSGATSANVWIYQDHDVGRLWERPGEAEAPGLFVSFPSLKDPSHGDDLHHTAQVVASCRWEPFAAWAGGQPGHRCEEYEAHKAWMAETLLAQFKRHFPRMAPLVDFHELSTPVTQEAYVAAHQGAMGGLEMTAGRLGSDALRIRTPVPGLLLAGQDAASLGVQGAVMGGVLAAAA
jgi:all-trans-retinol 13,14-reductase